MGGLTLALTLARQGVPFRVFEKEVEGRETGAGLLLAPNGTRILRRLGIWEEAARAGHVTIAWRILEHTGAVLRELRIEREELEALSIHRAKLVELMRSCLPVGSVVDGASVREFRTGERSVALMLGDGLVCEGRGLIGADGLRSAVRRQLFGEKPLRYRGYVGWRGIAPFVPDGYGGRALSETWGPGGRFGIAAVDARRTYWYASANGEEEWVEAGSERQGNLLRRFEGWHKPITDLIAATPNEDILLSRIYDGPRLRAWSKGNIALLGDAAHAMTPNLGQGACMAMEDGWALGSIIAAGLEPSEAFRRYEKARMRRANSIQRQSRAMGWVVQAERPLLVDARSWLTRRLPERLLKFGMQAVFAG